MALPPYLRLRECRYGPMLYNINATFIGQMLERYGECCENEIDVFRQLLRPGMCALDVGAAIGTHAVPMAKMVGEQGKVIAIEPQRSAFQMLCANIVLNGLTNVDTRWAAAGKQNGEIIVPILDPARKLAFGTIELGNWTEGEAVALIALDTLRPSRCDLIKIDVEGMEADVIAGGSALIGRFRPAIYVENDRADRSTALIEQLWRLNYDCYWHLALYLRFPNFRGETENIFPNMAAINMLCLPRERPAQVDLPKIATSDEHPSRR